MGFLKDFLFGEEQKVETQQLPRLSPEQQELLRFFGSGIRSNPDFVDAVTRPAAGYTGKLAPDLSSLERTSLAALEQQAMNAVGGGDPLVKGAKETVGRALGADQFNAGEFNEFFRGAVEDPMLRRFREEVLPEVTARFAHSPFGSDRLNAENRALDTLGSNLSAARADTAFKTKEAGRDRALRAAGMATPLASHNTDQLLQILAAGAVPRTVEDTRIAREYNEFVRQQDSKRKSMEMALALLGISPIENQSVVTGGSTGFLTALAGGAGQGLGMAGGKKLFGMM